MSLRLAPVVFAALLTLFMLLKDWWDGGALTVYNMVSTCAFGAIAGLLFYYLESRRRRKKQERAQNAE